MDCKESPKNLNCIYISHGYLEAPCLRRWQLGLIERLFAKINSRLWSATMPFVPSGNGWLSLLLIAYGCSFCQIKTVWRLCVHFCVCKFCKNPIILYINCWKFNNLFVVLKSNLLLLVSRVALIRLATTHSCNLRQRKPLSQQSPAVRHVAIASVDTRKQHWCSYS